MTTALFKTAGASLRSALFILLSLSMLNTGCKKDNNPASISTGTVTLANYQQVNLVSDTAFFNPVRIDPKLVNAWGIAIGPTGVFWISTNGNGSTVIYDTAGTQKLTPVNIPLGADQNGSAPSGAVYNGTPDFVIPGTGSPAVFIYSTEDGIISAWNPTTSASTKTVDSSVTGAVYKGLALANDGGANFIYATDFHNAKVDVYDKNFAVVTTKPFVDGSIPAGFAPFNIQNIGGQLYVTYAKQDGAAHDDVAGAGNGYVDIYTPAGVLVKRFASSGTLNSPWGIAQAPAAFGQVANAILVGSFGDGHISVFDASGVYQGQLLVGGTAISIPGLWGISFDDAGSINPDILYFTAGPFGEAHGLFGYLKKM